MSTLFGFVEAGTFAHLVLRPRAPILPPLPWAQFLTRGITNLLVDPLGTLRVGRGSSSQGVNQGKLVWKRSINMGRGANLQAPGHPTSGAKLGFD